MAFFQLTTDPPITYDPVGRCIYCQDDGSSKLSDEHIIPFSLNGTQVLPQASCRKCARITSYLDGFIARSVFYQARTGAGVQTRTRLPDEFPAILTFEDGHEERVMVPADVHPATLVLPHFAQPDYLSGRAPDGNFRFTYTTWMRSSAAFDEFMNAKGAKSAEVETSIKPQQFSRVLAKIAHSYAVARLGLNGFAPLLLDLIHGRRVTNAPELVGSDPETPVPASGIVHELHLTPHPKFVVVRIRLFASSSIEGEHSMPVYLVVAGERPAHAAPYHSRSAGRRPADSLTVRQHRPVKPRARTRRE